MDNKHTQIIKILQGIYPDAQCELDYKTPFELLVATILSAQSTDRQVNKVTKKLFEGYNSPELILSLSVEELGEYIQSIGFYNTKARNIHTMSRILIENFGGIVPRTMEELISLPGVGRKTANVVLSNAFKIPAFAVDTHVMRVSRRLGLTSKDTPNEIERDITSKIKPKMYSIAHHCLIFHGRRCCKARNPMCATCPLQDKCKYYKSLNR